MKITVVISAYNPPLCHSDSERSEGEESNYYNLYEN